MSSNTVWPSNSTDAPESSTESRGPESSVVSAQWAEARHAYPIYAALAKQSSIAEPPYPVGTSPEENPPQEIIDRDLHWLDEMDAHTKAFQIRQLPPVTLNANADALRAFIQRSLRKPEKTATDRDKIDFLVVQYFALCAPESMYHEEITLEDVTRVLTPLLGTIEITPLAWSLPLESILNASRECRSLRDLLERGLLEQGRLLKESSDDLFYDPAALVTFARFNFLMRRAFIQLLHADQNAVVKAIEELDRAGVHSVDCRRVGLSAAEPITQLRLFAENWRPLYHKDYSENAVNRSFEQLLALRNDLEEALAKLNAPAESKPSGDETGLEMYQSEKGSHPEDIAKNDWKNDSISLSIGPANAASSSSDSAKSQPNASGQTGGESPSPSAALYSGTKNTDAKSASASDSASAETAEPCASLPASSPAESHQETSASSGSETSSAFVTAEARAAKLAGDYAADSATSDAAVDAAGRVESPEASAAAPPVPAAVPIIGTTGSDSCMQAIWDQLVAAPPSRGRSMSTVVLKNTKVLLSSWEVAAFVSERGVDAEDLRRAVVARAMISVAMDARKQTSEMALLTSALQKARVEVSYFQGRVEQAKRAKNTEAAVNLGISTKRLLSFIEEAEKLEP